MRNFIFLYLKSNQHHVLVIGCWTQLFKSQSNIYPIAYQFPKQKKKSFVRKNVTLLIPITLLIRDSSGQVQLARLHRAQK